MGENSKIEWTTHTASPWHGCSKVAIGCDNCYAAALAPRNPGTLGIWGDDGVRIKSKSFIDKLRSWDAQARKAGTVASVFPSICDPFEDRPELVPWREEMFAAIDQLPNLRLLLLTKRPENVERMWPRYFQSRIDPHIWRTYRPNVWIGTSVAVQDDADKNVPALLECRRLSPVLFVSAEPLLGTVDLNGRLVSSDGFCCEPGGGIRHVDDGGRGIDWVIGGGESGPNARPCHPDRARALRDACESVGCPFLWKQWGEWIPYELSAQPPFWASQHGDEVDGHALPDLTECEPVNGWWAPDVAGVIYRHAGKKAAGRLLDGREWSQFPEGQHVR